MRLPPLNCDDKSHILFKERLGTLLTLTSSCGRWCAIALADPILWTNIFVDVMSSDFLRLHPGPSAGLRLKVIITGPHPVTHGDALPSAASHLKKLRIDAHPDYLSLGFLFPIFDGSLPKLRLLQLRNVPISLILDAFQARPLLEAVFIETCCILPNSRYVCTVATLSNLRRLHMTSDAVSKVQRQHLISHRAHRRFPT